MNASEPTTPRRPHPLAIILISRLGVLLIASVALVALPVRDGSQFGRFAPENVLVDGLVRWDSFWYASVATEGYENPNLAVQRREAFFPGFPMLIWVVNRVIPSPFISGLIVSNVCFVVAAWLFHRWALPHLGDDGALLALALLCAYPMTFYFNAMYSESVFLLGAVGAFYFAERERWLPAALLAAVCGATRLVGVLVMPGLVLLYLHSIGYDPRKIRLNVLWLVLGAGGTLGYMAYLWWYTGNPLEFAVAAQQGWPPAYDFVRLGNTASMFFSPGSFFSGDYPFHEVTNMLFGAVAFVTVLFIWRVLPFPYTMWAFLTLLVSASHWYNLGRYMMVVFPLYAVWAGALLPRPLLRGGVLYLCVMLSSLFTAVWALWYEVAW